LQDKNGTLSEEKNLSFCFTLTKSGTQSKRSSHLEDFFPLIEQASFSWVDIKVDDVHQEAIEIATQFGFLEEMVKQLLVRSTEEMHFLGGYQDFDIEIGLLFPVIRVEGFTIEISLYSYF
jgi:hypothetical protein